MISWSDVNTLQKQKLDLQIRLDELLKNGKASDDDVNEIKSEINHLEKNIRRILGSNELERQKKLRSNHNDEKVKKKYYALKSKYNLVKKLNESTNNFIKTIDSLDNSYESNIQNVKVKI